MSVTRKIKKTMARNKGIYFSAVVSHTEKKNNFRDMHSRLLNKQDSAFSLKSMLGMGKKRTLRERLGM